MRGWFLLACGSAALAAAAACAGSEPGERTAPDGGPPESAIPDAAAGDADVVEAEAAVKERRCSVAGWCETTLPDEDLVLFDVWPLPDRAFAIAESPTIGVKILEWREADSKWDYIDDGTQNEPGLGTFAGRIWSPGDNEVYFGVGPGFVYHGSRPSVGAAWAWTRHELPDNSHDGVVHPEDGLRTYWQMQRRYPSLGVWGTSAGDVYAWLTNTIYHWKSIDGGAPAWVPEHIVDDADISNANEHVLFVGAAGTTPDDVWFAAVRWTHPIGCALVVRRKGSVYERVADGTPAGDVCTPRVGTSMIGGAGGWLTDIHGVGPGQIIGLKGARDVVRISSADDGYTVESAPIGPSQALGLNAVNALRSVWSAPAGAVWLGARGIIVRGGDVWDGGVPELSSIALDGTPLSHVIYQVRGTSNTNLWAVGDRNALHKTNR